MIAAADRITDIIKGGRPTLPEVRRLFSDSGSNQISIEDWQAFYDTNSKELSEYCVITQNSGGPAIVAAGLLAYSSDGETLYCTQYTTGFNGPTVFTSIGTCLFNPAAGTSILGVAFGSTADGKTYFFEQSLAITFSQEEAGA
jgi:hypothetical protein